MVILARKRPLKQILLGLIALYTLGNLALAIRPDETAVLILRFISGLPHGAYFGVGAIVAERLVPPERKSSAVALMIAGMTIATDRCPFRHIRDGMAVMANGVLPHRPVGIQGFRPHLGVDSQNGPVAGYRFRR